MVEYLQSADAYYLNQLKSGIQLTVETIAFIWCTLSSTTGANMFLNPQIKCEL